MHRYKKYPVLEVNLEAIRNNARVMREYCMARGVSDVYKRQLPHRAEGEVNHGGYDP